MLLLLLLLTVPSLAQFYSYKDANGRLHITDKPMRKKGLKLVGKYTPKSVRDAKTVDERARALEERNSRTGSRQYNKYVLSKTQLSGLVDPIARSMNVDPDLVHAVIQIESSGNIRSHSNKGAMGLMQLIPATAKRFGVSKPWDPRQNVRGGIKYLQYLLSYFEGDVDLVLAAYNAGENAVDKHGGIPPYKETRNYVRKIRKLYSKKQLSYTDHATRKSKLVGKNETQAVGAG